MRTSSISQSSDRQHVKETDYDLVIEDKCSGAIPFFERPGGNEIQNYLEKGYVTSLNVWQIDRLGRNLRDILNTIHFFTQKGIAIIFVSQGLRTIDDDGKENPISKLMISILGTVGEMERNQIRERQMEGIRLAKARKKYTGRKPGSKEDVAKFLSKPANAKVVEYLRRGMKGTEAAKLAGVSVNTVVKIRKHTFKN